MKLFIDVKVRKTALKTIEKPQLFYWEKDPNKKKHYRPIRKINEDEMHEEIRNFIVESENLPFISLDEIPLERFTKKQLKRRDFFMSMF